MKKVFCMMLALIMVFALAACGGETKLPAETEEPEAYDVIMHLPPEMAEEFTQEDLDQGIREGAFHDARFNDDGSLTFEVSKSQQKILLGSLSDGMLEGIQGMVGSEDFPNITKVEANEDFTHFTIITKSQELDEAEAMSYLVVCIVSAEYNYIAGRTDVTVIADYVNEESGKIITTFNSDDLE